MAEKVTPLSQRAVHFNVDSTGNKDGSSNLQGNSGLTLSIRRTPARIHRYTPYRKTPNTRRKHSQLKTSRTPSRKVKSAEVSQNVLEGFTSKTWKMFKVTPLYKWSYKTRDLRGYAKLLGAYLAAESRKGVAVEMDDIVDNVTISVMKGIKQTKDEEESIEITMKAKPKTGNEMKVVLTAVLCSVQLQPEYRPVANTGDKFTCLPVMLVRGSATLTQRLHAWLQSQFDCSMSLLTLNPLSLSWMAAMWSGDIPAKQAKPVELLYSVPKDIKGLTRISLTVQAKDCQKLWKCVHDEENEEFMEEEVAAFVLSLEEHFHYHFGIHLKALQLSRIGTAVTYAGADGRLKIFSPSHVIPILAHLTELASEHVLSI